MTFNENFQANVSLRKLFNVSSCHTTLPVSWLMIVGVDHAHSTIELQISKLIVEIKHAHISAAENFYKCASFSFPVLEMIKHKLGL